MGALQLVAIRQHLSNNESESKQREKTYKKKVWVVGKDQFRCINSVVVTFVQVMHRDTTWPASRERMNRLVHMLVNRLHEL